MPTDCLLIGMVFMIWVVIAGRKRESKGDEGCTRTGGGNSNVLLSNNNAYFRYHTINPSIKLRFLRGENKQTNKNPNAIIQPPQLSLL